MKLFIYEYVGSYCQGGYVCIADNEINAEGLLVKQNVAKNIERRNSDIVRYEQIKDTALSRDTPVSENTESNLKRLKYETEEYYRKYEESEFEKHFKLLHEFPIKIFCNFGLISEEKILLDNYDCS